MNPEDMEWTEKHQQMSEPDYFCEWCGKPLKENVTVHDTKKET